MAAVLIENFTDWNATANATNAAAEGWALTGSYSLVAGARESTKAAQFDSNNYMTHAVDSASTMYLCVRMKIVSASGTSGRTSIGFYEGGTNHIGIGVTAAQKLEILRAGTNLATSVEALPTGTWVQLQIKVVIHDSAGSVEIRKDGAASAFVGVSGVDTRNGVTGIIDTLLIGTVSTFGGTLAFMDLAAWTDAGESPTSWVGDARIDSCLPSGAGSSAQATPSAGSNYECMDEAQQDGDTSYVQSATNGHIDLYAMANMTHTPSTIHAVAATVLAKKTDAGTGSIKARMKSGATALSGSEVALSADAYKRVSLIKGVDPNTSAAWEKAAVDALEAGFEVVI